MREPKPVNEEIRQAVERGLVRRLLCQKLLTEAEAAKLLRLIEG